MALRPGGAKAKGASGELELAAVLETEARVRAGVNLKLVRNLEQVRAGGHDLVGLEPFGMAVEVKRVEVLAVTAWWSQTKLAAAKVGCRPVLAYRQNRKPWRFRIEGWVHPCTVALPIDLEAEAFYRWFADALKSGAPQR